MAYNNQGGHRDRSGGGARPSPQPIIGQRSNSSQGDLGGGRPNVSFSNDPHRTASSQSVLPPLPGKFSKPSFHSQPSATSSSYEPELGYGNTSGATAHNAPAPGSGGIGGLLGLGNPGGPHGGASDVNRKKSLVRPERERIDPNHRLWHYREHAERQADVMPSTTGNAPPRGYGGGAMMPPVLTSGGSGGGDNNQQPPGLRRGKSVLAREPSEGPQESGLNFLRRGATLRRKQSSAGKAQQAGFGAGSSRSATKDLRAKEKTGILGDFAPGPKNAWMVYCYLLTICVPGFVLRGVFGKRTPEAQRAWREKIGLVSINAFLMAAVGFLTFGFTQTVCGTQNLRIQGGSVNSGSMVINGYDYDFSTWKHPAVAGYFNGTQDPMYMDQWQAGGKDGSFLFQNVNENCLDIITPASTTSIAKSGNRLGWYFPCNLFNQHGSSPVNQTGYDQSTLCHTSTSARDQFYNYKPAGQVYYTWEQVQNTSRNLVVYESNVLDLSLLKWLSTTQVSYPSFFDSVKNGNATYQGKDITMLMYRSGMKKYGACLSDIVRVGFIDSKSIGCVASDVVLYVSLVFILGVVIIKFVMAVIFGWFLSWRLGNFKGESYQQRMARAAEIENWTDDIYRPAPSRYRPSVPQAKTGGKKSFLPTTSRFSKADALVVPSSRPGTAYGGVTDNGNGGGGYGRPRMASTYKLSPPGSPMLRSSRSSTSLPFGRDESRMSLYNDAQSNCPFPLTNVIPQPPVDYEPFNFPLMHNICLVTAYSESIEGLRTTLDSLATTDYPNSHKLILVVADGMVRGSGSKLKTPDIVLGMMKELVVPEQEVEAHSYVAIADGHKRHNMAKVYAGFYDYDNATVEASKQQKVPMVLVAKVGNPLEVNDAKPGNRGKRDSQIVLMSFLQKVMFDERMTTFEYEFFNSIWRVTGISPDRFEGVLCVDADTKVFPDSLTRMTACMVHDPEIMGLCGETKIANKTETWVTMIQVFEYYISHHLTKAFESMFGGVTCLPGCFSMYRIKAPKGDTGYWVPILANPDIVEHYSENVVDTLHKKNLLLLGEDRFLTTLMLKTFPKRKMMFAPQAVCKTIVPDTFRVLLSQRRRWINSTIHNLFELMLVRDLCGTFCFSMQFVVFMELVGTLVLPAAISFTLYIIIISIVPTGQPKPIISLILLAFILGLPGLLIVITSRKIAYVGWMLIYLLSLPIWNLVLPGYAFWHMDDFSWGETRKVEGSTKDKSHGDKEGLFDSTQIVMKRWVEFERERRWKSGTHSRDSYYDVIQRSTSPKRSSMASASGFSSGFSHETYGAGSDTPFRPSQSFGAMSPPDALEPPIGRFRGGPRDPSPASSDSNGHDGSEGGQYFAGAQYSSVPNPSYDEGQPIFRGAMPANHRDSASSGLTYESEDYTQYQPQTFANPSSAIPPSSSRRGVSLTDDGPAADAEPIVRRVPRSTSKRTSMGSPPPSMRSQQPQQGFSSGGLPPGAAPAQQTSSRFV